MRTIPETTISQGERNELVAAILDATPSYGPEDRKGIAPFLLEFPASTLKTMDRAARKSSLYCLTSELTREVFKRFSLTPDVMDRFVTLLDDHYVEVMNSLTEEYLVPVEGDIVGQAITGVLIINEKEVLTSKQQRQLILILAASGLNESLASIRNTSSKYGRAFLTEDECLLDYVRSHPEDTHFDGVLNLLSTSKIFGRFIEVLESTGAESENAYALVGGII